MIATFDPRLERLIPVGLNARVAAESPYDLAVAIGSDINSGTKLALAHEWLMDVDYYDRLEDVVIEMHTVGRLRDGLTLREPLPTELAYLGRLGLWP